MSAEVRVDPVDLHISAKTVDVHADDMRARHVAADGRIEAAMTGIPAGAAAALTGVVEKWQEDTSAIYGRLIDHAHGLRSGAAAYLQADEAGATGITEADATVLDLGI